MLSVSEQQTQERSSSHTFNTDTFSMTVQCSFQTFILFLSQRWLNPVETLNALAWVTLTCGGPSCQGNPRWSAFGSVCRWTNRQANTIAFLLRWLDPQTDESKNTHRQIKHEITLRLLLKGKLGVAPFFPLLHTSFCFSQTFLVMLLLVNTSMNLLIRKTIITSAHRWTN